MRSGAAFVVVIGFVLMGVAAREGLSFAGKDGRTVIERTRIVLPAGTKALNCKAKPTPDAPCDVARTKDPDDDNTDRVLSSRLQGPGTYVIAITPSEQTAKEPTDWRVNVVPGWAGLLAGLGLLLVVAFLPPAISPPQTTPDGRKLSAWYRLLAELPDGGYSLGRSQFVIWFVPAAILYGAVSISTASFAPLDARTMILLGLSGTTTLLAGATTPEGTSPITTKPDVSDLIRDWQKGQPDLTRYQYLILSILGAVVVFSGFFDGMQMPAIPTQFLVLVGGSQAAYLGTKALKGGPKTTPTTTPAAEPTPAEPAGATAPAVKEAVDLVTELDASGANPLDEKTYLYYPGADIPAEKMKTRGRYSKGYPRGAIVHYTAGRHGTSALEWGREQGFCYFLIDERGTVHQSFPLDCWGYHAGESYAEGIGKSVSRELVGIEIACAGLVQEHDGRFKAWFHRGSESLSREEVRHSSDLTGPGADAIAQGWYEKFTREQEDALLALLRWLRSNSPPGVFQYDYVLGHNEVAPRRKQDPGASLSMTMPELRERLAQAAVVA